MSRIGNDNIAEEQRNIQNINNANYNLENYYPVFKDGDVSNCTINFSNPTKEF